MPLTGVVINDGRAIVGLTGTMFVDAMIQSGISEKVAQRILRKFATYREKWHEIIGVSFLSEHKKEEYRRLIDDRLKSPTMIWNSASKVITDYASNKACTSLDYKEHAGFWLKLM